MFEKLLLDFEVKQRFLSYAHRTSLIMWKSFTSLTLIHAFETWEKSLICAVWTGWALKSGNDLFANPDSTTHGQPWPPRECRAMFSTSCKDERNISKWLVWFLLVVRRQYSLCTSGSPVF